MSINAVRLIFAAAALGTFATSFAQSGTISVAGTANIFGAGTNSTPSPGGNGGGTVAPVIDLLPNRSHFTFSVTGSVSWDTELFTGPDGSKITTTDVAPYNGISGVAFPRFFPLVGVFLDSTNPDLSTPPAKFVYSSDTALTNSVYSPSLRQIFFIGDGLRQTGSGSVQRFLIPTGATRLYLGIADQSFDNKAGAYEDNAGSFQVTYQAVPEPATLLGLGIAGLTMATRRRRRR